jgi:hypothetical protein
LNNVSYELGLLGTGLGFSEEPTKGLFQPMSGTLTKSLCTHVPHLLRGLNKVMEVDYKSLAMAPTRDIAQPQPHPFDIRINVYI